MKSSIKRIKEPLRIFSKKHCSSEVLALVLTVPSQFPNWAAFGAQQHHFSTQIVTCLCFHMNNLHGSSLYTGEPRDHAAAFTAWGQASHKECYPLLFISESPLCSPHPGTHKLPSTSPEGQFWGVRQSTKHWTSAEPHPGQGQPATGPGGASTPPAGSQLGTPATSFSLK